MAVTGMPEWFDEFADQDLYRRNAFRISGLPVTATARDVRRRLAELRAAEALGNEAVGCDGWLPLTPPPDHDVVREALRRLDDPVRRIIHEFLWLWPLPDGDASTLTSARKKWAEWTRRATDSAAVATRYYGDIAAHNLAVLTHLRALEDNQPGSLRHLELCHISYGYWRMVRESDGCWRWLDDRIRALDDPRLRGISAVAVRDAITGFLLTIHAKLAFDAARASGDDVARQHVALMYEFGPTNVVQTALTDAAQPIAIRTGLLVDQTDRRGGDPTALDRAAASLLKETATDLRVLRAVLGEEHPDTTETTDRVAIAVQDAAVACGNLMRPDTESAIRGRYLARAAAHLRSARELAVGEHTRTLIDENLAGVLSNALLASYERATAKGEESPTLGARLAIKLLDDTQAALRELGELRPDHSDNDMIHDAIAIRASALITGYFNVTGNVGEALGAYRKVLSVAAGLETRSVIQRNINTLVAMRAATPAVTAPRRPPVTRPPARPTPTSRRPARAGRRRNAADSGAVFWWAVVILMVIFVLEISTGR
jgi:hypothetical protein